MDEFVEDLLTREYMADGLHGDMQQKELEREMIGVTALVKTNEVAITEKVSEMFGKLKTGRAKRLSGQDGAFLGYQDGKNMQLNKGLENG